MSSIECVVDSSGRILIVGRKWVKVSRGLTASVTVGGRYCLSDVFDAKYDLIQENHSYKILKINQQS